MARFQRGTGNIVLEGIKDGTDDNTAATRGYVNGISPGSLTIHDWPGTFQSNFDVAVGSHWSRTVAGQLVVWTFVGHSDVTISSSNFSDYIPQSTESFWTEFGAEGAANEYPATFAELFYARLGTIWLGSDTHLYLATADHVIHSTQTLTDNDPATTTTGWRRLDNNLPAAPASNSSTTQNYELQVSATGDTTTWVAATGGGGGGLNAVISDNTLRGNGASQSTALSVSRLQTWNTETAYVLGDMVVDNFDYQIYKADVANIPALQIVTLPTVQRVSFGNATGFTELRYLIEFVGTNPTLDPAQTYDVSIGSPGAAINVNFTILGSDISTTDLTGFWVISPTATSYTVVSGATPTIRTSNPLTNISISLGTAVANPRPGLDPTRWVEVSNTDVAFEARYSPSRSETLRWTEDGTTYDGFIEDIFFEDVLAANSTVVRGSDNIVRYTITGVRPSIVEALVAADRMVFTSARLPIRTFGTVTAGATPDSAILIGTSIQSDGGEDSDAVTVGNGILARGPQTFRGSFAAVTIRADAPTPTNLVEDFHSVADSAARMALTSTDVKFGDIVYQQDTTTRYEVTHAQTAVANFVNLSWVASLSGNGGLELALHFSDTATMPVDADTYTVISGGDTWSFLGSRATTRTAANNTIEWRIPDASIGGSSNRTGLDRVSSLFTAAAGIAFTKVSDFSNVSQLVNQWPSTYTSEFRVGAGEIWARGNRIFVATNGIVTPINTQLILELNAPGNNSGEWQELTNAHVIKDWPTAFSASDRFVIRDHEIYQLSTGELYLRIGGLATVQTSAIFTTNIPADNNALWRRIDGVGSGGGGGNAAIVDTNGTPTLAMDITAEEVRTLLGAGTLNETDFRFHRDNENLILNIGNSTFNVDMQDIRQGPTLPVTAHNNEVFWLNVPSGGRMAGLYRYQSDISVWFPADAVFNDVSIDRLTVDANLQIPSHGVLSAADANDAVSVGDLRAEAQAIRNSIAPDITVHGDLEEEEDTAYVYKQSIELTGAVANTEGTFRHARQVPLQNNYPTMPSSNVDLTPLVLAAYPDAPLRGRQGSTGTHRIDQYQPTANMGRIGGTVPLERATSGTAGFQLDEDFVAAGGFVDNPADPRIDTPNARFLLGQDNGALIGVNNSTGMFTTPTGGILTGMIFQPQRVAEDHTGKYPLWTMNFQARNVSDSRNVGVFLEETPDPGTIPVLNPTDAEWLEDGAFFDIRWASGDPMPSESEQVIYTLTFRDSTTYTFAGNDNNGNHITTRTFNGNFFWRIPRDLITFSGGDTPDSGHFSGLALRRSTPGEYNMRIRLGTNSDALLRDDDGLLLFTDGDEYAIISHLHIDSNNRLALNAYVYRWDIVSSRWVIFTGLRTATGVTGFNVSVLNAGEAIDVINPTIRIGLFEYQNNTSSFNNNLAMSKIFIAKVETPTFNAAAATAIINDSDPFNGLAQSNSTSGFEFTRLDYVDIPYSSYDAAAGTFTPTADWLLPDTSVSDPSGFRTALGSSGLWRPVSEAMQSDGDILGSGTLPARSRQFPTSGTDPFLVIHPTGTGYVDPILATTALPVGPAKGGVSNTTGASASMALPQGPIADIDYHTTTGTDGASPIGYISTGQWDRTDFLGDGSAGTARIWAVPSTAVESVSFELGTTGTDGSARLYVPQFRNDWRLANSTTMNPLSPLGRADFDPNTHYVVGRFLDGASRVIYFTAGAFDPQTGLVSGLARVDTPIAGTNSGAAPTGSNTELYKQDVSDPNLRTDNIAIFRFASFRFEAGAPVNVLEEAGQRGDVLPFGMFGMLELFLGTAGNTIGSGESQRIAYQRRGVTFYWYPNRSDTMGGPLGVWQNYVGNNDPDETLGQWRLPLIG